MMIPLLHILVPNHPNIYSCTRQYDWHVFEGLYISVYISGHHLIKRVCIHSLTTELCPGREGPVLFGDDENGYALSYLFKLHDAYARGETRLYSLMVLMTDRVFLISCWPFFVR